MSGQPLECSSHQTSRRIEVIPSPGELRLEVGEVRPTEGGVCGHTVETVLVITAPKPVEEHQMSFDEFVRTLLAAPVG
jgi:hypothetical protein